MPLPLLLLLLLLQHCPSILPAPTITTAAFIDPAATKHAGMAVAPRPTASADDGAPVPGHLRCDGAAAAGSAGAAAGAAGR